MTSIVKVGAFDYTLDPGPWQATGVQFSGAQPGGHGSASFEVPVPNAYLAPHHALREGEWVKLYDDSHELYEGQILSIKPSVSGNAHKLSVVCGGLISVAALRGDIAATWVHRGSEGWVRRPGTPQNLGNVSLDAGKIDLRVSVGSTQSFNAASMETALEAIYVLDSAISDDIISHVDIAGTYDVSAEGAYSWRWELYSAPDLATWTLTALSASNATGSVSDHVSFALADATKALLLVVWNPAGAIHAVAAEKYLTLTTCDIFCFGRDPSDPDGTWIARTTKPRIDECMVALALRPGLAVTATTKAAIGAPLDDAYVGSGKDKTNAAAAQAYIAGLHAQPFEWGYWDNREFIIGPTPSVPDNDSRVIVVGGGKPGLESWEVSETNSEDCPAYACVLFGNKDDATLPEGWPRRIYVPSTPADTADLRIVTVNYSALILSDAAAFAAGAQVVGAASGAAIPDGAVFDANPATADTGSVPAAPGNNTDPTDEYEQTDSALAHGHLAGFAWTPVSGWAGSGSQDDPACLVNPPGGLGRVIFGDYGACDFAGGAFTVRFWLRLDEAVVGDVRIVGGKMDDVTGWYLGVDSGQHLVGYVGQGANYQQQTGATALSVGVWYDAYMVYAGSGGLVTLWLATVGGVPALEATTLAGAAGAWDADNAGNLLLFKVN